MGCQEVCECVERVLYHWQKVQRLNARDKYNNPTPRRGREETLYTYMYVLSKQDVLTHAVASVKECRVK